MLTTPEEYLSSLNFDAPFSDDSHPVLSTEERAFVEKYLGAQVLRAYSGEEPVPAPMRMETPAPRPRPVVEPRIEIVVQKLEQSAAQAPALAREKFEEPVWLEIAQIPEPEETWEVAVEEAAPKVEGPEDGITAAEEAETPAPEETPLTGQVDANEPAKPEIKEEIRIEPEVVVPVSSAPEPVQAVAAHAPRPRIIFEARLRKREREKARLAEKNGQVERVEAASAVEPAVDVEAPAVETAAPERLAQKPALETPAKISDAEQGSGDPVRNLAETLVKVEAPAAILAPASEVKTANVGNPAVETLAKAEAQPVVTLRELAARESVIRMVSFYVEGQLFLLPVAGIQEVVRNMELIKVPQTPYFVAGAINLRGKVMPLVHLSALLTSARTYKYSDKSFIIIYGSANMQIGLIIDKISSMHMLDHNRIIWNVESRLGDAGEFLCAIANLDDRVCGIVAPELITGKLLSS